VVSPAAIRARRQPVLNIRSIGLRRHAKTWEECLPRCASTTDLAVRLKTIRRSSAFFTQRPRTMNTEVSSCRTGTSHILRRMLPNNVMAPILIMATAFLGEAILLEASLSFLGLRLQEPTAASGLMLRDALDPRRRTQ
jgi:hypothetical protein